MLLKIKNTSSIVYALLYKLNTYQYLIKGEIFSVTIQIMDFSSYCLSVEVVRIFMDARTGIPLLRRLKIAYSINALSTNIRNASFAEIL